MRSLDIWTVDLVVSGPQVTKCLPWLSLEERDRAAKFKFDEHRREFIVSHGVLRTLLSRFAGIDPAAIEFSYGPNGKPRLKDGGLAVCFNMSHSEKLAVYALTRGCEIGVDV